MPIDSHTAVVFFHGIGSQRRHEEVSRLIDALDRYAFLEGQTVGRLQQIHGEYEVSRVEDHADFAYVSVQHSPVASGKRVKQTIRFYEGYWAALNRKSYTLPQLFWWSVRHLFTPVRLIATRWRAEPRVRRRMLHQVADIDSSPSGRKALRRVLEAYNEFERANLRRKYPKGTFNDFVDSLPADRAEDRYLAHRWRRAFVVHQLKMLGVLSSMLLAVLLAVFAVVFGVLQALELASIWDLSSTLGEAYEPSWRNAFALTGTLVLAGVAGMASRMLGDVVGWAAYRETDPHYEVREAILQQAIDTLRHVLLDPATERVVVVGHSLGTAIAYDALLTLGNQHSAAGAGGAARVGDLSKVDQFITLGSPIDTLHSLAESHRGRYHRYVRLEEAFRGDVGSPPFSPVDKPRKPHVHWINVWDRFDPIATPIYSPNDKNAAAMPVDNMCVTSLVFPDPTTSHNSYFHHRQVVETIFRATILGEFSYRDQARPTRIGQSSPRRRTAIPQIAILAFPWIAVTAIVARVLSAPRWIADVAALGTAALAVVMILGVVIARLVGVRPALTGRASAT